MTHRWLTRALIAVAVPALLVPAVASSAHAAPPLALPSIEDVAKVDPAFEGGTAEVSRDKVFAVGEKCDEGKAIKGATGRSATYLPPLDVSDPDTFVMPAQAVYISAEGLPSVRMARDYLRAGRTQMVRCADTEGILGPKATTTVKKIPLKLGAESWGYRITWKTKKSKVVTNVLYVRKGKHIVGVVSLPMDDSGTAPSIPTSIALARLAVKTVG